jgi:8-oxo-dGTP diphosphatase
MMKTMPNALPVLCVAVVVRHPDTGHVLMLRRHREVGTYDPWDVNWCLLGGCVEWGESPEEGVLRELQEETGLFIIGSLRLLGVTSHVTGSRHQVGLVYLANQWGGWPVNREPHHHDRLEWVDPADPPRPLMPGVATVLGWLREGRTP